MTRLQRIRAALKKPRCDGHIIGADGLNVGDARLLLRLADAARRWRAKGSRAFGIEPDESLARLVARLEEKV